MFPKYGNTILSSNFGTVVKKGFWKNILLTNFVIHLSTNLKDLSSNKDIILQKADKGNSVVLVNKAGYIRRMK